MAVTDDKDRPKRNDLPDRAARRIIELLFPQAGLLVNRPKDPLMSGIKDRIERDVSRAIWDEMLLLEGEITLGKRGLPE